MESCLKLISYTLCEQQLLSKLENRSYDFFACSSLLNKLTKNVLNRHGFLIGARNGLQKDHVGMILPLAAANWPFKHDCFDQLYIHNQSTYVLMPQWCLVATTRARFFLHNSAILSH